MSMHCTIEVCCDNCEDVVDVFEFEVVDGDCIGDNHEDTDMVLQDDGQWLCQDCDESLEDEED